MSDEFTVPVGFLQGCSLSLVLLNVFMDDVSWLSQSLEGVQFGNHLLCSAAFFADYVVMLASSGQDL